MQPVEPETRSRVIQLLDAGTLGRNAIARETGLSGAAVTKIAKEHGHTFDTTNSELAVAAAKVQAQELRMLIAQKMLIRASEALDDMDAPTVTGHWSNATEFRTSEYLEHTTDGPTISDRRNLMTIAAIGYQRAGELLDRTDTSKVDAGRSVLAGLQASLRGAADALSSIDPTLEPNPASARAQYDDLIGETGDTDPLEGTVNTALDPDRSV